MNKDWLDATRGGDVDFVRELLDGGADINALDKHGQTALMNAAHRGDVSLVHLLIHRGATLDHKAKHGLTALMLAVIANRPEVVYELVRAGADLGMAGTKGHFAHTPLQYAEEHGLREIVDLLRADA